MLMTCERSMWLPAWAAALGLAAGSAPAQPCEPLWSDEFAPTGLNSFAWDLAVFDDGSARGPTVYVGGSFTKAGPFTLDRIAMLRDATWSPVGGGVDGSVFSLAPCQSCPDRGANLYVGGAFHRAGGETAHGVARWDGRSWSALGAGVDFGSLSFCEVLLVTGNLFEQGPQLYAGGYFDSAGGLPASNIARWDGEAWSALGGGLNGVVNALAVFDDGAGPALYAGGSFTMAGEVEAFNIARWDGATWSAVGGGVGGYSVDALEVFDDGSGASLFVGGSFLNAGGVEAVGIARWDGKSWSAVGGGVSGGYEWVAHLLVVDDGTGPALYAGGGFMAAGSTPANNIARWDGSAWTPLGDGVDLSVLGLAATGAGTPDAVLLAGGFFVTAGDAHAERVAAWNGAEWSAVTRPEPFPGEYAAVHDLEVFDDGLGTVPALYAGGRFDEAGSVETGAIARFDGRNWTSPDGGVGGLHAIVRAMEVFDDGSGHGLYVGGDFTFAGSGQVKANGIARWDGAQWSPLGGGVAGAAGVYALAASSSGFGGGPALYVGGAFVQVDSTPASLVARWDGRTWSALGSGIYLDDSLVLTLLVVDKPSAIGPALYAGGTFNQAGGVSARSIAKWDGESWSPLGEGVDGSVRALAVYDDGRGPALYAGGDFQTAGGIHAGGAARWDGVSWSSVGGVGAGEIYDLAVFEASADTSPALYAGGYFNVAGGADARSIARYNGGFWTPMGEGVGDYYPVVRAVTGFDDGLGDGPAVMIGGEFETAGGIPSPRIAKWIGCSSDELPPFTPCRYAVEVIDGPGCRQIGLNAINEAGTVAGGFNECSFGPARAFEWTPESGLDVLEMPPNVTASWAYGLNEAGVIVGSHTLNDDGELGSLAFRLAGNEVLNLGTLPGGKTSFALAINEPGDIVGFWSSTDYYNEAVAFVWRGRMVDLGPDLGTLRSSAVDINDQGQVTGWMGSSATSDGRAFLWQDGTVTNIGTVPGGLTGSGSAINNKAQVVVYGKVDFGGGWPYVTRTFIWHEGRWTDLGVLDGYDHCVGYGISDAGVVVGRCAVAGTSVGTAFVWRDGSMAELDDVIGWDSPVHVEYAQAVNSAGRIIGAGSGVGLVLTPIERAQGDIDGDCRVNHFDFGIMLFEWGEAGSPADLDGDAIVDINDLLTLLANWNDAGG